MFWFILGMSLASSGNIVGPGGANFIEVVNCRDSSIKGLASIASITSIYPYKNMTKIKSYSGDYCLEIPYKTFIDNVKSATLKQVKEEICKK